ncbi:NADPH:quinone reductase-like Zn-dependent oxidoreductase [Herbihabitans rhizosphaerae]|uniref:NADPH:quinone reductase-like Zn-dependent oxidoreductase n=1 Tax=Herbihabitans rhizosphaerae TaxID=1872711 RepID=A0A4Q7KDE9_9PSEU|nr:NADP-dependent oxidoreductase [Herbihabitans rhizosphaerae]RZS32234.1 NADPH:quinone reductase-like Zn-dependent oxidoreductase [Herbihabitans rhizosphaerae]
MRAVVLSSYGGPEVLESADRPRPEPGEREVLVRVEAATVNPVDLGTRMGVFDPGATAPSAPIGLGWDVAGVIERTGEDVTRFAEGDRVIGLQDQPIVPLGTYAEYVVLGEDAVAAAPAGHTAAEAATLPLNGLTARQALDLLDLREGRTLLITGAAGGVGGYAVELAAGRGLKVIAVAGADDEEWITARGAEFLPRSADLASAVRAVAPSGVDGALDAATVGEPALDAVADGGAFVAVLPPQVPDPVRGIRTAAVGVRADGGQLAELVAEVEAGRLSLRLAETYPLDEVARAHERFAKGGLRGRLVLVP